MIAKQVNKSILVAVVKRLKNVVEVWPNLN